jgi:ribosomal protein S18 acetylase RimI-like enzyme
VRAPPPSRAVIREATPGDAAELARLRWEFRVEEQPAQPRDEFLSGFESWLHEALASGRWVVSVAESAPGTLCGCMYLERVTKLPLPGTLRREWGYITSAYVAAEERGRGLGQELLGHLVEAARERRLEFLILWPSDEALPFYRRAGFRPVSDLWTGAAGEPPLALVL